MMASSSMPRPIALRSSIDNNGGNFENESPVELEYADYEHRTVEVSPEFGHTREKNTNEEIEIRPNTGMLNDSQCYPRFEIQ